MPGIVPWKRERMEPEQRLLFAFVDLDTGMSRTRINSLFGHRLKSVEIAALLGDLQERGLVQGELQKPKGGKGRSTEVWSITSKGEQWVKDRRA